ncbi:ataxin-7-like protein 3 isoform b [Pimephales promelas]|nr:ataxin-7-like protein 3 isoform b [Pimephales promelas]
MKMEDVSLSSMDNSKMEGFAQEILSDLVEDACLGLCFEVHRAVKQGYFFLDDTDQESMKDFEIVDQPGVDIFGQVYNQWKNKECVCPNCSRSIAASRFAPHLEKCLGMGRNSSRIANRRIASGNNTNKSESDQEDNDDVNDNDWSYGAEKKAKKRKSDKNPNSPRRSKSMKHKNVCFQQTEQKKGSGEDFHIKEGGASEPHLPLRNRHGQDSSFEGIYQLEQSFLESSLCNAVSTPKTNFVLA